MQNVKNETSMGLDLVAGSVSGSIASLATYPLEVCYVYAGVTFFADDQDTHAGANKSTQSVL